MPNGGRHLMIFNPLSSQDRSRSKSRGLQSWKQTGNLLLFLLLSVKTFCPSMHLKITILVYVTWWWAFIHWRSRGASEWMVPCLSLVCVLIWVNKLVPNFSQNFEYQKWHNSFKTKENIFFLVCFGKKDFPKFDNGTIVQSHYSLSVSSLHYLPPHLPTPPPTFLVRLWFYVHHILTTTKWLSA